MRPGSHSSLFGLLLGLVFVTVLSAGLALESTLASATRRARGDLPRALTAAVREASDEADAVLLTEGTALVTAHRYDQVAALLSARTEEVATAPSHQLAARAALADGAFDAFARHAAFAGRLEPGSTEAATAAKQAVDLALLARTRPAARVLGLLSGAFLLGLGLRAARRRRYRRELASWLAGLDGRVVCRVDGEAVSEGKLAALGPATTSLTVDVFLTPRGPQRRPPNPGPTLAVVLSQGASNRTVRLTPHHDVRDDAVRIRVRDATLERILECPGTWRLQAQVDGRLVGQARVAVAPPPPSRGGRKLLLLGRA